MKLSRTPRTGRMKLEGENGDRWCLYWDKDLMYNVINFMG